MDRSREGLIVRVLVALPLRMRAGYIVIRWQNGSEFDPPHRGPTMGIGDGDAVFEALQIIRLKREGREGVLLHGVLPASRDACIRRQWSSWCQEGDDNGKHFGSEFHE